MSRPRAVRKKEFLDAYAKHKTVMDLAIELGVCEMTVRNYLTKLGLDIKGTVEKRQQSLDIYNAYCGKITLPELSKQFGISEITVRYHLRKAMIDLYSKPKQNKLRWPRPRILSHIKIVHLLNKNSALVKKPERIAEKTNLSDECVAIYLNYVKANIKPKKLKTK